MTRWAYAALASLTLLVALPAHAIQVLEGRPGQTLVGKISTTHLTRITVANDRIRNVRGIEGTLIIEPDKDTGDVYVRPRFTNNAVSIYITTRKKRTYALLLEPTRDKVETLIIKDVTPAPEEMTTVEKAGDYIKVIKEMVRVMAVSDVPEDMEIKELNKTLPLWQDTTFVLERRWIASQIVGEKYRLVNKGTKPMVLAEQEFYVKGVAAVTIENMQLAAGEATNIFIVRQR
ncbi:MAG: hypothetical protein AMS22_11475 [Thiotrichales bacterium SG8_50]|nr:MAG: hypothetical protein AMS22_11475 [Thiotrichales bacterium SG8_50]